MQITSVRIRLVTNPNGKTRAGATMIIDDQFAIHDVRVVEGSNGLFVAMPSVKGADGTYHDIAHPVTGEARVAIQEAVLAAYHRAVESGAGPAGVGGVGGG